jgi:putative heme iron utilization protein
MSEQSKSEDELRHEMREFQSAFRSVLMATVSQDGEPEASYAPYVVDDAGRYYVFVSGLARHTRDLQETGQASLQFIEDESEAHNLFARRRLTWLCAVTVIPRASTDWELMLHQFTLRFGKFIDTLRGLPDFQLFRLTPLSGSYVRGFGQAFRFEGPGI